MHYVLDNRAVCVCERRTMFALNPITVDSSLFVTTGPSADYQRW